MKHRHLGHIHVVYGRGPARPRPKARAGYLFAWARVRTLFVGIDWR